jgi:glutamyl-tRNA synthetase
MSELDKIIRKHVLKNAFDYGKANPGSVVGKVIGEFPQCKKDMKGTMKLITDSVNKVNRMDKDQIEKEMESFEYVKKVEKEKTLELPNVKAGGVVTRFPPEPSGYPHIGHAKAAFLNYEAAKTYDGSMILRFDDTNPEKESNEYVEAIKDGLEWLGIEWNKESYTSEHMDEIYKAAEMLISKGKAYVCIANQQEISEMRTSGIEVPCRSLGIKEHLSRWVDMLSGKLKAVLLYRGDLESPNTVMRDPALARILETEHYKQGTQYRVWPGYDLAVVVMDHLEGLTHPMRSKEYELRNELYGALFADFGWERPELVEFSRLAIKNAPISKRLLGPLVTENRVLGWDDPRLPTLAGLKRRGIVPQAIKNFVLSFGLSKVESEPDWSMLLKENKKIVDLDCAHYFFVQDPVELEIIGAEPQKLKLKKHPKADLGFREMDIGNKIYISKSDAEALNNGDEVRLKDLFNIKILETGNNKLKAQFAGDKMVDKKIQFVPENGVQCKILIPKDLLKDGEFDPESLQEANGLCEPDCLQIKPDNIIQFERFGFCRLDAKDKNMLVFIYSC